MQIVTDRACDISDFQAQGLKINYIPLKLTLDGKSYSSGEDLTSDQFYDLLETSNDLPTTSLPSAGIFAEIYRKLAQTDPDILSIHVSSGLSGTFESARLGAEMVPEANVTLWDSQTLSAPLAWQVEVAAKAIRAGKPLPEILDLLAYVRKGTEGMFTLDSLKYLIHGGRISHLKGLLASVLHIRPLIAVDKVTGKYYTLSQERTLRRAINKLAETVEKFYPVGSRVRVQLLHARNPDALDPLKEAVEKLYQCEWVPTVAIGPILGAHTGPTLIGLCVGPADVFDML
jgi:DegV family protein with EDD domain